MRQIKSGTMFGASGQLYLLAAIGPERYAALVAMRTGHSTGSEVLPNRVTLTGSFYDAAALAELLKGCVELGVFAGYTTPGSEYEEEEAA